MLIYTVVSDRYIQYVPLFELFVATEYPEYSLRVDEIKSPTVQYEAACKRFLYDDVGDEVYITDADMMILREEPTIQEYHSSEARSLGLPYSNTKRHKEAYADKRVTGLHYATRPFYEHTEALRERYLDKINNGSWGKCKFDDEFMLFDLCSHFGPVPSRGLLSRHHGIHLGTARAYRRHTLQTRNGQLRKRIKPWQARRFVEIMDSQEGLKIREKIKKSCFNTSWEIEEVYRFCRCNSKGK